MRPPMRRAVLVLVPVVEGIEDGEEGGEGVAQVFAVNGRGIGGFHGRDILAAQPTFLLSPAARHSKSFGGGGEPVRLSHSNFAVRETGAMTIFATHDKLGR